MSDSFSILHTRTLPFRSLKFTQSGVSLGDFKSPFYLFVFYFLFFCRWKVDRNTMEESKLPSSVCDTQAMLWVIWNIYFNFISWNQFFVCVQVPRKDLEGRGRPVTDSGRRQLPHQRKSETTGHIHSGFKVCLHLIIFESLSNSRGIIALSPPRTKELLLCCLYWKGRLDQIYWAETPELNK